MSHCCRKQEGVKERTYFLPWAPSLNAGQRTDTSVKGNMPKGRPTGWQYKCLWLWSPRLARVHTHSQRQQLLTGAMCTSWRSLAWRAIYFQCGVLLHCRGSVPSIPVCTLDTICILVDASTSIILLWSMDSEYLKEWAFLKAIQFSIPVRDLGMLLPVDLIC